MSAARHLPPHPSRGGDVPASIRKAAKDGQAGAVLAWLDGGGWVDETLEDIFDGGSRESGMTLLMVALANGHAELAEALLRRGADVSLLTSAGSCYALGLAAVNGYVWACGGGGREKETLGVVTQKGPLVMYS